MRGLPPLASFCFLVFSFSLPIHANDTAEIEAALNAIGTGSAVEIKNRLCTDRITVFDDQTRARAIAALPAVIREHRMTEGKLLRRLALILKQLLQLHIRVRSSQQPELVLFEHEMPTAQLWRGCILLVSSSLAEMLYDGELAGIFAHELSHAYFEDEMATAQRSHDERAMRVIELKCDGVAIVSISLLGFTPTQFVSGLQRIQAHTKRLGRSSGIQQSHPELTVRAQFSERLLKAIQ